jgi:hypothetical protein
MKEAAVARKRTGAAGVSGKKVGTKMLSWSKVRRALDALGWDADQFIARYESSGRRVRRPDPDLLAAGEAFDKTGDLDAFRVAVVAKNTQELYAKLGRYQVWKSGSGAAPRGSAPESGAEA